MIDRVGEGGRGGRKGMDSRDGRKGRKGKDERGDLTGKIICQGAYSIACMS